MIGAYIAVILGVAVWAVLTPVSRKLPEGVVRGVTVFGGAFLLAVCVLSLLPESVNIIFPEDGELEIDQRPFFAILAGFLIQQVLESLSAHAEHGHVEDHNANAPVLGLMLGLCLHAFLEGMPLVDMDGSVNHGLLYGILIHNIPVALILVGLMTGRGYNLWRVLGWLTLFGAMSPLGSLFNLYIIQPNEETQRLILGLVVGVLLHVSSSILFDHKQHDKLWLNLGLSLAAFALAFFTIH
ncbi:MAG: ZIP family metal transporter [Bacteroidales bacterium]|nr:ZIP family metal transporter [Bacteroidales bacterium]